MYAGFQGFREVPGGFVGFGVILYEIGRVRTFAMLLPDLLAGLALVVAVAALAVARGTKRRHDRLQQAYWDLRYEHSRLKAQVKRLDPDESAEPEPAGSPASTTFIPLSSLKR